MVKRLWSVIGIACLTLQGCGTLERLPAVPADRTTQAVVPGIPNARYWVDTDLSPFINDALKSIEREMKYQGAAAAKGKLPPTHFLAISGGGDDGAFGAGLLNGWTETGTRPEFKIVTGVSTGALTAPFAYLGSKYDGVLRDVYTSVGPKDIFEPRSMVAALTSDGMADNSPLWGLLSKFVTVDLLKEIAAE